MHPLIRVLVLIFACEAPLLCHAAADAARPQIFFSDLQSGPSTGGENNEGAFVTIYGSGFGDSRGESFVAIGGMAAYGYPVWSDRKITFQLGHNAHTGPIVLHKVPVATSNGVPFTIRRGKISFYSSEAHHPLPDEIRNLRAGDILYLRDGTHQLSLDKYESSLSIVTSGKEDEPIALIAYPNAGVTIGSVTGPRMAARTPNVERKSDHWVIAGLNFRGNQEALDVTASRDWRVVGNDFSCPEGFGPTGCIEMGQVSQVAFLGNNIHDIAKPGTTKTYHALYFTTDSNHIEVGWNTIAHVQGCRAIQFHSSPIGPGTGKNQFDLHVHDNTIHDVVCDAINFATVDPSKGPVEAYNNVIYNVGTGPDPADGSANYSCVYVQGGANSGAPGSGSVEIYNNTMYNCGARKNTDSGALSLSGGSPEQFAHFRNNLIVLDRGVHLLSPNSTATPLRGEANLVWWSDGSGPQALPKGFVIKDPLMHDASHADFTIRATSPAVGAGVNIAQGTSDSIKAQANHPDIGALQHK